MLVNFVSVRSVLTKSLAPLTLLISPHTVKVRLQLNLQPPLRLLPLLPLVFLHPSPTPIPISYKHTASRSPLNLGRKLHLDSDGSCLNTVYNNIQKEREVRQLDIQTPRDRAGSAAHATAAHATNVSACSVPQSSVWQITVGASFAKSREMMDFLVTYECLALRDP